MKRFVSMAAGVVFATAACAILTAALIAGCSGNSGGESDHQQMAENAGHAAKEMVGKAADAISSYKTKWKGTIALLEKGFEPIKEAAGSLDNAELKDMVGKIGSGLDDAKSMLAGMKDDGGENLDKQKQAFESKVGEVKTLLSSAESKIKELMPDFNKMGENAKVKMP